MPSSPSVSTRSSRTSRGSGDESYYRAVRPHTHTLSAPVQGTRQGETLSSAHVSSPQTSVIYPIHGSTGRTRSSGLVQVSDRAHTSRSRESHHSSPFALPKPSAIIEELPVSQTAHMRRRSRTSSLVLSPETNVTYIIDGSPIRRSENPRRGSKRSSHLESLGADNTRSSSSRGSNRSSRLTSPRTDVTYDIEGSPRSSVGVPISDTQLPGSHTAPPATGLPRIVAGSSNGNSPVRHTPVSPGRVFISSTPAISPRTLLTPVRSHLSEPIVGTSPSSRQSHESTPSCRVTAAPHVVVGPPPDLVSYFGSDTESETDDGQEVETLLSPLSSPRLTLPTSGLFLLNPNQQSTNLSPTVSPSCPTRGPYAMPNESVASNVCPTCSTPLTNPPSDIDRGGLGLLGLSPSHVPNAIHAPTEDPRSPMARNLSVPGVSAKYAPLFTYS